MWQTGEWDKIIHFTVSSCTTVTMKAQGLLYKCNINYPQCTASTECDQESLTFSPGMSL